MHKIILKKSKTFKTNQKMKELQDYKKPKTSDTFKNIRNTEEHQRYIRSTKHPTINTRYKIISTLQSRSFKN